MNYVNYDIMMKKNITVFDNSVELILGDPIFWEHEKYKTICQYSLVFWRGIQTQILQCFFLLSFMIWESNE